MQVLRVSRGIALLFTRTFGTRWGGVVSPTSRRPLPPGKTQYPLYRRLGGPQDQSGRAENLFPTGIRSKCTDINTVIALFTTTHQNSKDIALEVKVIPEFE